MTFSKFCMLTFLFLKIEREIPVRLTLDIHALLTGNSRTPLEFLTRANAGVREGGKYLSELPLQTVEEYPGKKCISHRQKTLSGTSTES